MSKFCLHGVQIEVSRDGKSATVRELVRDGRRKVPGKVLYEAVSSGGVTAEVAALQWAKARRRSKASELPHVAEAATAVDESAELEDER